MAEMYASLEEINEIAQGILGSFSRVGNTVYGQTTYRDPSTMTVGGHYSQMKESDFRAAEQVLYHLGQARSCAGGGSLRKHGFDSEVQAIIDAFKQGNEAIVEVGRFLARLTEQYEMCEARLVNKLGDFGMIPQTDRAWVEDTLDPIGGYTDTSRGLIFALTDTFISLSNGESPNGRKWAEAFLDLGEDGFYGVDACFADVSTKKTTRNADGERVTDVVEYRFLCLTGKYAGGNPKGNTEGFSVAANFLSYGQGKEKGNKVSLGIGPALSYMKTYNDDGSSDTTVEIPINLPKGAPQVLKTITQWAPMPSGTFHRDDDKQPI